MKAYNYTIADDYQQKIYIPIIGIELKGKMTILLFVLGLIAGTLGLGTPLSLLIGSNGFVISGAASAMLCYGLVLYNNEKNKNSGRTKLQEFYYQTIKKYRLIYDSKGKKHYVAPRQEGVIYVNVCRTGLHLRKHRLVQ